MPIIAQNDDLGLEDNESMQNDEESNTKALVQIRFGFSWLGNGVEAIHSEGTSPPNGVSSSQFINYIGAGLQLSFTPFAGIAPSVDIRIDKYLYIAESGRAVRTQIHTGSSLGPVARVLSLGFNLPWFMTLPLGKTAQFNLAAGLGIILQVPITPLDGTKDMSAISSYLLGDARWLNLYLEPGFAFKLNEDLEFSISTKIIFPIWHVWGKDSLPVYDHLELGIIFGVYM